MALARLFLVEAKGAPFDRTLHFAHGFLLFDEVGRDGFGQGFLRGFVYGGLVGGRKGHVDQLVLLKTKRC